MKWALNPGKQWNLPPSAGSIGKQSSAGCVRMHNDDVIELYDIVPKGTEVTIVDDATKPQAVKSPEVAQAPAAGPVTVSGRSNSEQ